MKVEQWNSLASEMPCWSARMSQPGPVQWSEFLRQGRETFILNRREKTHATSQNINFADFYCVWHLEFELLRDDRLHGPRVITQSSLVLSLGASNCKKILSSKPIVRKKIGQKSTLYYVRMSTQLF